MKRAAICLLLVGVGCRASTGGTRLFSGSDQVGGLVAGEVIAVALGHATKSVVAAIEVSDAERAKRESPKTTASDEDLAREWREVRDRQMRR